jgi:hypothetical protein
MLVLKQWIWTEIKVRQYKLVMHFEGNWSNKGKAGPLQAWTGPEGG